MAPKNGEKFLVQALPNILRGSPGEGSVAEHRTRQTWTQLYRPETLVPAQGSQNIPLLAAAAGLALTEDDDAARHRALLETWRAYAEGPWWANEPGTRNVYGSWITTSILVAHAFAASAGHGDARRALHRLIRSTAVLLTLGSGWTRRRDVKTKASGGYPVTLCGARSTVTSARPTPVGRSRRDPAGRAFQPNFLYHHPLSELLLGLLTGQMPLVWTRRRRKPWECEVLEAVAERTGVHPLRALRGVERGVLRRLIQSRGRNEDLLNTAVSWLNEGPLPKSPFDFLRFRDGAATLNRRGINPGSTNPMYAYVWWADERPESWLDLYDWGRADRQVDCLWLDDPGTRGRGRLGYTYLDLERRVVRGLRIARDDYYDDRTLQYAKGLKEITLPPGRLIWHVEVGPRGAQLSRVKEPLPFWFPL